MKHLIVGAGFSGICAAIKLQEDDENDFVVLERGNDVGGTWRDNTYPGAACDVPSQLYSYSFAHADWSRSFSLQAEIHSYLRRTAERYSVLDRFLFNTNFDSAVWDNDWRQWIVMTSSGQGSRTFTSTTLILGAGGLSEPKRPDLEGIDGFEGELFHSSRWKHDVNLTNKRVAVIGTGASAIQIVPEVANVACHVDVYQRSAPYVLPRQDRQYSKLERLALQRVPGLRKVYRTVIYWAREAYVPGFTVTPKLAEPARRAAIAHLEKGIDDISLRSRLTPTFTIGCKRILISNTYYPALNSPEVDLVTEAPVRVTKTAIETSDGVARPVDVIIVATGFHTTDLPIAKRITGRTGQTLAATWQETGMAAHKGSTIPGFPNLFMIVGPNTALGHSSMVLMIESQVRYLRRAIRTMNRHQFVSIEPTLSSTRAWNEALQRRLRRTVWNTGGCSSWYLDRHGRNTVLWPRTTFAFRFFLSRFDLPAYAVARDVVGDVSPEAGPASGG